MNTDSVLERLRRHFDNPKNVFEGRKYFQNIYDAKDRRIARAKSIIDSMSNGEFKEFMIKFLEWETKYEDMFYNRGVLTSSNFFTAITDVVIDEGTEEDSEQDFSSGVYVYKDLTFELFMGQGSFWRISNTTGEIDFQTT